MKNTIKYIGSIAIMANVFIASCTKPDRSDDFPKGDPPPVPGGYTNSSQVASSNLLAYWNFDGTNNETKSGTAPSTVRNASFISGIKGQALQLNAGFLLYPTIAALSSANAIPSCTVSLWVKVANNGSQASCFFTLAQSTTVQSDWLAVVNVGAETGRPVTNTNLALHSWVGNYSTGSRRGGDNINDYGTAGTDFQNVANSGQWIHYMMRYDGIAETVDLFANNVRVSNNNFRVRTGLGALVLPTPTQVLLGGFPNTVTGFNLSPVQGFQALLTGSIDELRVYSKAFTDAEIAALYLLEKQGR